VAQIAPAVVNPQAFRSDDFSMAWTTMHFGVGMACAGAAAAGFSLVTGRGWRWLPAAMTLGGVWALGPDIPGMVREQLPSFPLSSILGSRQLELWLHRIGDLFFFHRALDAQPHERALHGLILILALYNAAIVLLMWREHRALNHPAIRAWHAQAPHLPKRSASPRRSRRSRRRARPIPLEERLPTANRIVPVVSDPANPVIGRISPIASTDGRVPAPPDRLAE
jgi:hypothetical protein